MLFLRLTYKEQVIAHAEAFGLFAKIEVVAHILLKALVVERVDGILYKLAETVRRHLVTYSNTAIPQKLSRTTYRVEHERMVIELKGLLVVVTAEQVIGMLSLHRQYNDIV